MKRISVIVLAAVAALVLTAGVGSASAVERGANVLCATPTNPCPSADVLPAGSVVGFGAGNFNFKASSTVNIFCTGQNFTSKTTAESGSPLPAEGSPNWVWDCTRGSSKDTCTVTLNNTSNTISAGWSQSVGTVSLGSEGQTLQVSIKCAVFTATAECTYAATGSVGLKSYIDSGVFVGKIEPTTLQRTAANIPSLCNEFGTMTLTEAQQTETYLSRA